MATNAYEPPSSGRNGAREEEEWLTVREMRDYMRVGRTKAYELVRDGDVRTYRLGRKILVSRSSIDGYIRVNGSAGRLGTEGNRER